VWASIETGRAGLPVAIGKPAFAAPKLTCGWLAVSTSRGLARDYFQLASGMRVWALRKPALPRSRQTGTTRQELAHIQSQPPFTYWSQNTRCHLLTYLEIATKYRYFGLDDVHLLSATQIRLTEQLFCERGAPVENSVYRNQ